MDELYYELLNYHRSDGSKKIIFLIHGCFDVLYNDKSPACTFFLFLKPFYVLNEYILHVVLVSILHGVLECESLLETGDAEDSLNNSSSQYTFTEPLPENIVVDEGETAEFYCRVSSHDAPVTWYIDGIQIYESDKYVTEVHNAERRLYIQHSNKFDEGTITALLQNDETSTQFLVEGVCVHLLEPKPSDIPPLVTQDFSKTAIFVVFFGKAL